MSQIDSFNCRNILAVGDQTYVYYSLVDAEKNGLAGISRLPFSMKIILENLLRHEDHSSVTKQDIQQVARWLTDKGHHGSEISYRPARVLMQDFTGVPAVVDLAAMRDAMVQLGGNPEKINPLIPVDLVIDHSVIVDEFGNQQALKQNVALEYQRNGERYRFLKWGQQAFKNFRVVPPGTGICHQVNLEYLSRLVWTKEENGVHLAYPDSCIGTDSHTTMVNGLGVLGWGVGGIEAEAAMLGQPISMLLPEIIGFRLVGRLREGVTATDLVLTITKMLRAKGVVGKFVEFFGSGLDHMTLADRATIGNMAPEYGATCGFFPIDQETLRYLSMTGRDAHCLALVEAYARTQGLFREKDQQAPIFTDELQLDMGDVVPSMSGPKRPESCTPLEQIGDHFRIALCQEYHKQDDPNTDSADANDASHFAVKGEEMNLDHGDLNHGDVVIAAITSCTNTSNPDVLVAAGLLARNAIARGLQVKPWVKTSLAPGSQVVAAYLANSGLQASFDRLGFYLVGFGCTTCIGNSGPLHPEISRIIQDKQLVTVSVLSGNRNFEGRVSPDVQANYLASPPLVVAYALAGTILKDLTKEPIGTGSDGIPVYLRDIWPENSEVQEFIETNITKSLFVEKYHNVFAGDEHWKNIKIPRGNTYAWDENSTYVRHAPYFDSMPREPAAMMDIRQARILGLFGDKITTDHISPAGSIQKDSPAGAYLLAQGVEPADFNQYGTRRGNHEVMVRGTFANIRIHNYMLGAEGRKGGYSYYYSAGAKERCETTVYDAAMQYKMNAIPLVIFAGIEYGNGSSRDWAAKGPNLLGVRAVIAQSFERIHRSNLIGMGIVPFVFADEGMSWRTLGLIGDESVTIEGIAALKPRETVMATIVSPNSAIEGTIQKIALTCRIDTEDELKYFQNGGILQTVLRNLLQETNPELAQ